MLNILVVDDSALIRYGIKKIVLEKYPDAFIYEAVDGSEALRLTRKHQIDIVILDISLPDKNGIDVMKEIKRDSPRLPVLILSGHSEERYAIRALKDGAGGYLNKNTSINEICQAIAKILRDGKYISASLAELLADNIGQECGLSLTELLSDREYQVFLLLAAGAMVSEVAEQLSISINTVSTYRTRILEKMKMKRNADLTRYAIRKKLID